MTLNITDPVPLLCIEYPIQNLFNVSFVYKSMNEIFSLKRNKQPTIVGWFLHISLRAFNLHVLKVTMKIRENPLFLMKFISTMI